MAFTPQLLRNGGGEKISFQSPEYWHLSFKEVRVNPDFFEMILSVFFQKISENKNELLNKKPT